MRFEWHAEVTLYRHQADQTHAVNDIVELSASIDGCRTSGRHMPFDSAGELRLLELLGLEIPVSYQKVRDAQALYQTCQLSQNLPVLWRCCCLSWVQIDDCQQKGPTIQPQKVCCPSRGLLLACIKGIQVFPVAYEDSALSASFRGDGCILPIDVPTAHLQFVLGCVCSFAHLVVLHCHKQMSRPSEQVVLRFA